MPTFNKYTNQVCGGVQIHITDYEKFDSVETAMHILRAYLEVSPINVSVASDRSYGRIGFSQQIKNFQIPVNNILNDCAGDLNVYKAQAQKCWIYKNGQRI